MERIYQQKTFCRSIYSRKNEGMSEIATKNNKNKNKNKLINEAYQSESNLTRRGKYTTWSCSK